MFDYVPGVETEAGPLVCLAAMCRVLGLQAPAGHAVAAEQMPPEVHALLVHRRGMTRTIEEACAQQVDLEVVRSTEPGRVLTRQVLLVLRQTRTPAVMAFVDIHLDNYPDEPRRLIREQTAPLGSILRIAGVSPCYDAHAYCLLTSGLAAVQDAGVRGDPLYARRVRISDIAGRVLADAVEIVLPALARLAAAGGRSRETAR
jgi:chorismate-pyruvate lyase